MAGPAASVACPAAGAGVAGGGDCLMVVAPVSDTSSGGSTPTWAHQWAPGERDNNVTRIMSELVHSGGEWLMQG